MRDAFVRKLTEIARTDRRIALITGDLGFGVLDRFAAEFPDQYINAGIAEQNMSAIASGLALTGWRPYTYSIANFTTLRCLEQIRNDICYHDASVTIVSVGGGFSYGQLGMSHFATEDLAILRALPNLRVVAPSEPWETEDLVAELARTDGPAYLRLDKGKGGIDRLPGEVARLGKARVLRPGRDVTIVTVGAVLSEALVAADQLATQRIDARVVSLNALKPFDDEAILSAARETGGIVSVEEHTILGGLGSAIAESCLESGAPPRAFRRLGLRDLYPSVVGDQAYLRREYGLCRKAIVAAVLSMLG